MDDRTYDSVTDGLWDRINKGVCDIQSRAFYVSAANENSQRQWKDIRAKYVEGEDSE